MARIKANTAYGAVYIITLKTCQLRYIIVIKNPYLKSRNY